MPTPSTWQTASVALKRAGDPSTLSRVAGLEFILTAPDGSWPSLGVRGGVRRHSASFMVVEAQSGTTGAFSSRTISISDLGQLSVVGQSPPNPTETSDWSFVQLAYSAQFDARLSRATPAMLLDVAQSSLRVCGGNTATKRTTNGTTITETASHSADQLGIPPRGGMPRTLEG